MNTFKLNWIAFLIAFILGISYVYFTTPVPKVVIKYPNPYNSNKTVYKDESDTCYKYKATKVVCPENDKNITQQPVYTSM